MLPIQSTNSEADHFLTEITNSNEDSTGVRDIILETLEAVGNVDGLTVSVTPPNPSDTDGIKNADEQKCDHTVTVSAELPQNLEFVNMLGFDVSVLRARTTLRYGRQPLCF
jgi:hypothetical protein